MKWFIDPARYGQDKTRIVQYKEPYCIGAAKDSLIDSMSLYNTAIHIMGLYTIADEKPEKIEIENAGLGSVLADQLQDWGLPAKAVMSPQI